MFPRHPACLSLGFLVIFSLSASCFIIPEEIPTLLSLVYSYIPVIKKGTDSRLGVGFRLGEHADFQVMLELGPQNNTEPIGENEVDSKRKREAILEAAMRGQMGPISQAIARRHLERKFISAWENHKQKRSEKNSQKIEKPKKIKQDKVDKSSIDDSNWLQKWSEKMQKLPAAYGYPQNEESKNRSRIELMTNINRNNSNESNDKNSEDINRDMLLLRKLLESKSSNATTS